MKRLLLAAVLSLAGLAHAATVSGFNGSFDVSNWTQSPGTGSINIAGAPNSISLTSGDDGSGTPSLTNFYIQFLVDATVTFSWSYQTTDDPFADPFGYVLANTEASLDATSFAQLTDDFGAASQSGTATVFVMANQYFGFSGWTIDNEFGAATTTIRGLQIDDGTGTIPEPSSLLLLGAALAAAGAATRRRRAA